MPQIAVIGSGIVGLTTALEIQAAGHGVMIFAESFPGDEKTIRYTSPWAAAHHVSVPGDDDAKLKMERETFERFWAESEEGREEARCYLRTPQREYYHYEVQGKTGLEHMPGFRSLAPEELIPPAVSGVAFSTVTIDTSTYLPFLLSRFLARGGRIRRAHVQHIDQVLLGAWGTPVPDALVLCPGIGARFLGGVEDRAIYPIRGQTVLVRAPWVREGRGTRVREGHFTYIIARPSGEIILGGTQNPHDWYPHPRPETARAILERTLALFPELAPPAVRAEGRQASVADLEPLVIEHGCGLRPARQGGMRLEGGVVRPEAGGRAVPVVYSYGHGGSGYQASWGSARVAAELLEQGLKSST